jgi:hypothetical protein
MGPHIPHDTKTPQMFSLRRPGSNHEKSTKGPKRTLADRKFIYHAAHVIFASTTDFWVHAVSWRHFKWHMRYCELNRHKWGNGKEEGENVKGVFFPNREVERDGSFWAKPRGENG